MGCAIATVKCLLFFFNALFAISGLALLIKGALQFAVLYDLSDSLENVSVYGPSLGLIVIGSIVFIIAFFGCCGVILESHCMVVTFAVFLSIIVIAEVVIGIILFVNKDGWDKPIDENLKELFSKYNTNSTDNGADKLQNALDCCGIDGPSYWQTPPHYLPTPPLSCCKFPNENCTSWSDEKNIYQIGCEDEIKDFLKAGGLLLGILAIAFGIVEITGIVFAICLANSIKNQHGRIYSPGYN